MINLNKLKVNQKIYYEYDPKIILNFMVGNIDRYSNFVDLIFLDGHNDGKYGFSTGGVYTYTFRYLGESPWWHLAFDVAKIWREVLND